MNSECTDDSLVSYTSLFKKTKKAIWKPNYYLYRLVYQGDRFIRTPPDSPETTKTTKTNDDNKDKR